MRSQIEKKFATNILSTLPNGVICDRTIVGTPDIFFPRIKLALFFNGCFWHNHGCRDLRANSDWVIKLEFRKLKDERIRVELARTGITVITVWECQWHTKQQHLMRHIQDMHQLLSLYQRSK